MRFFDRYISRLIAWPLMVTVVIAVMLLLLDNMLRLFQFALALGGPLPIVWKMLMSLIPEYLSLGLVLGLFLSVSLAFRNLALSNELDVIVGTGIPERRLMRIPFIFAALICVINFALVGFVEPRGEKVFELLRRDMSAGLLGITVKAGELTKLSNNLAFRVDEIRNGSDDMRGIFFRRVDDKGEQWVGVSQKGKVVADAQTQGLVLRLSDGTLVRSNPKDKQPATMEFGSLDLDIHSPSHAQFLAPPMKLTQYTLPELWTIGHDPQVDASTQRGALAKFFRRIAQILFCLFIPPLAMALAVPPKRVSSAYGLFVGLIIVVAFMKIADGAEQMAASRSIDPLYAQAIPLLIFAALSGWLFQVTVSRDRGYLVGAIDQSFSAILEGAMRGIMAGRSLFGFGSRSEKRLESRSAMLEKSTIRTKILGEAQHILIIFESFELGGTERIALRLAEAWVEAGRDVTIFAGRADGPLAAMLPQGVKVVLADRHIAEGPLSGVRLALGLNRVLGRLRPDIIFCPGNYYTDTAVVLRLMAGRGCPPIVAKLSNALRRADMPWLVQVGYEVWLRLQKHFIDLYVAMSPALATEAQSVMGLRPDQMVMIKDPALPSQSKLQDTISEDIPNLPAVPYILAVGRLVRQKNFPGLIQSFEKVAAQRAIQLVILGEGDQREVVEAQIEKLGLQDRVTLVGYASNVGGWLRQAELFAMSSTYEGLPAVLIEAMASGVPIVTTQCSAAITELLEDGRLGRIVPVGDMDALADAMIAGLTSAHDPAPLREKAMDYCMDVGSAAYLNAFDVKTHRLPRQPDEIREAAVTYG
ncbi:LptF/LptG family permease [Govanella unica]|uniref:LptF/LptG family permease n=1 Tax=Govanella unica TaxID=2975056 RepID=A0A9X3Z7I3_9PROT|nr:LptF/LptG family permease [Govania unica]MDA5194192.1 LptF/LptG family permease [Govania unica]